MDGETKVLVSHAGLKGVFKDPEEEVYYFTKQKTLNDKQSFFMIPSLSRFFVMPDFVKNKLKSRDDLIISEQDKQYAKYRGIWHECPSCGYEQHCGSVFLKNSNVAIGHCIQNESYNFSIVSEEIYLDCNRVYIDHSEEDNDED
tara:strand:+ start:75 stop:506 length:432 start_codon:yes stop_codon:yes gene_type:complete